MGVLMRIGIITFHRALNYGAVLQTWALQETLKHMGHEVEVIDYTSEQMRVCASAFYMYGKEKSLRNCISALKNMPYRLIKINKFKKFCKKWISTSKPVAKEKLDSIADDYDIFITGSDQVWNDHLAGFDSAYFLSFVKENRKKFSYAASFGFESVPSYLCDDYRRRLESFNLISVREQKGADIVCQLTGKKAVVSADPTLLISRDNWQTMLPQNKRKEKYILIYLLNPVVELMKVVSDIAEKENLKIYYICLETKNLFNYSEYKRLKHIIVPSPEKFLCYIRDAELVATNSFHGTVFSIIFNKRFIVETVYGEEKNNRIQELLKMTGLENRDISINKNAGAEQRKKLPNNINEYRKDSLNYLKKVCSTCSCT